MNGSVKDEDADSELLKTLKGLLRTGMVAHKCDVGVSKDNQLAIANCSYEISELGKATLISLSKIWSVEP